jgi:hypothetical protein
MLRKISAVAILGTMLGISQGALLFALPPVVPQAKKEAGEQHPHIRAAIQELREAKRELQTAAHDFGGHRAEAVEAVDNAMKHPACAALRCNTTKNTMQC